MSINEMKCIPALFVTSEVFLESKVPGGAQICTKEYIETLGAAGFSLSILSFQLDNSVYKRIIHKLYHPLYGNFFPTDLAKRIVNEINTNNIKVVFFNQVELGFLAREIRKESARDIKIVILSHGLESTDFLHNIRLKKNFNNFAGISLKDRLILGDGIIAEACQRQYVDHVFCLSPVDVEIERWLGSRCVDWLPRAIKSNPLNWTPNFLYLGFLGTLNHAPSLEGLDLFLKAFQKIAPKDARLRIVGGPSTIGKALQERFSVVDYLGVLSEEQLLPEIKKWACFVHPLFCYPRGCSTKLATAIGWQIPIVTTRSGCRGYTWREGSMYLADTPDEFARLALNMINKENAVKAQKEIKLIAESSPTVQEIGFQMRSSLKSIMM